MNVSRAPMTNATRIALLLLLVLIAWMLGYWLTPPGPAASTDRHRAGGAGPAVTFDPIDSLAPGVVDAEHGVSPGVPGSAEQDPPAGEGGANASRPATGVSDGAEEGSVEQAPVGTGVTPEDTAAPEIIPPEFILHTVVSGDTPNSISQQYYGTSRRWDAILRANPMQDLHRRLRVGMVIRVPKDPDNVQGVPRDGGETGGGSAPELEYLEYRVKSGDTLTEIAQTIYGRASFWTLIRDANPEVGRDGTRLRSGMTLHIPPKPAGE